MIEPARYDMPRAYAGNTFGDITVDFADVGDISGWTFDLTISAGPNVLKKVTLGDGLSVLGTVLRIGPFTTPNPSSSSAPTDYELRAKRPDGTDDAYLVGLMPIIRDLNT